MTTIVKIEHAVPAATVEKIRAFLDEEIRENPDWNGATLEIERDDFTSVECDRLRGVMLYRAIVPIIEGGTE